MGGLTESLARISVIGIVAWGVIATGDADATTTPLSNEAPQTAPWKAAASAAATSTAPAARRAARFGRPRNKGRVLNAGNYWNRGHAANSGNFTNITYSKNANNSQSGSANNASGPQKIIVRVR